MAPPRLVVNIPSSSSAPSPSPSPSPIHTYSENEVETDGGFLEFTSSPPFTVTLLFIGLFIIIVAAVIAFSWWRARQARGLVVRPVGPPVRNRENGCVVSEKPVLWDLWTGTSGGSGAAVSPRKTWRDVMPFSVKQTKHPDVVPQSTTTPDAARDGHTSCNGAVLRAVSSTIRRHYLLAQLPAVAPPPPPLPPQAPPSERDEPGGRLPHPELEEMCARGSALQIAVTIAMPTPHVMQGDVPYYYAAGELPEFCIGTLEVHFKGR